MKKKIYSLIVLIFAVSLFIGASSLAAGDDNFINVKLTRPIKNNKVIKLESKTGFLLEDENRNVIQNIEETNIKAQLEGSGDISLIDLEGKPILTLAKENMNLISAKEEKGLVKIEDTNYRGSINLQNIGGLIRVLNNIDIEEYLYGLVPREMPASFPKEALKAQAVAGRTYAMQNTSKHIKEGYNICDTTHCQVYGGYDGEKPATTLAVEDTRGLVARYKGEMINAQYHSCSGGYTNSSVDVWGGDTPYLIGVKDDYSKASPHNQWSLSIDKKELESKLAASGIKIGELQSIDLSKVSAGGNVETIALKGSKSTKEIKGSAFRTIVGNTTLKSTKFTVKDGLINKPVLEEKQVYVIGASGEKMLLDLKQTNVIGRDGKEKKLAGANKIQTANSLEDLNIEVREENNSSSSNVGAIIVLEGRGFGHGVGMSQYGAKGMAEEGHTYDEILKFYYSGIDIQ